MRKVFRTIRKIITTVILVFLISLIIFTGAGLILANKYGDRIKEYTLEQINQQLETKVSVEDIDISFFSRIPYLSVVFTEVTVWSSNTFNREQFRIPVDTLLSADKIFLQLNVIDVIRGKYRVKRIYALNGKLNMLTDSGAGTNFRILSSQMQGKEEEGKAFEIEAVRLSNFDFYFTNLVKNISAYTQVEDILLKGKFSRSDFSLGTAAGFTIVSLEREGISYADHHEIDLRLVMNVKDSLYTIDKGDLVLNNIRMSARGNLEMGKETQMDLEFASRDVNLSAIMTSLPENLKDKLPGKAGGKADIAIRAKGPFSQVETPLIEAAWKLDIHEMIWKERKIRNLRLLGKFSNGEKTSPESTMITVEKFSFRDYRSDLEGKLMIENLKSPYLDLDLEGEVDISVLNDLVVEEGLSNFKGKLISDLTLRTRFQSAKNLKLEDFFAGGIAGSLGLENVSFDLKPGMEIREMNGKMDFAGNSWYPDAEFILNGMRTSLVLRIDNVSRYIFSGDFPLMLTGEIQTEGLNLDPLIGNRKEEGKTKEKSDLFPDLLRADVDLRAGSISAGKFIAEDFSAGLKYQNGFIGLENMGFRNSGGSFKGKAALTEKPGKGVEIRSVAELESIRIKDLFTSFHNFGQDFIRDDNLEGILFADVTFTATFDSLWKMDRQQLYTRADILIQSGELVDFEPARRLSKFIEVEELERIQFSTLENQILIENGNIFIPEMDISSSAFNINLSGTHSFDNYLDYRLKVRLSELLTRKAGRAKKENEENFVVEEDPRRASIYLSLTGLSDDVKIKYNQKQAVVNVKEDIQDEKRNLKNILNEEFGLFARDSAVNNAGEQKGSPKFIIDWDEEEPAAKKDSTGNRRKRR